MKIGLKLIPYFLLLSFSVSAQNLTGTWEGNTGNYYKLVILQINDSCFGYTYDTGFGHCKANFIGSYNEVSKKLAGLNTNFIDRNILHNLSRYNLAYSKKGNIEYLSGNILPKNGGFGHGILYRKISEDIDTTKLMSAKIQFYQPQVAESKLEKKQDEPVTVKVEDPIPAQKINSIPDLRSVKESRTSTLIKSLETEADSIRLVLYDNGEIDGDTVTVFYNSVIIYNSVPLSVKPLEITLAVNKNSSNTIELMANNLGGIPPNTALLLIYAGKERYELRVSSDYSTNARIDILHKDLQR